MIMKAKKRLVVVGNGMAGARLVEEAIARGGRDQYEITVFGDEPYGNYNRILLSNVLARSQDPDDIFLNPMAWYEENGVALHAGTKVMWVDRRMKRVAHQGGSVRYDILVLATGSSAFIPPFKGVNGDAGALKPGVFVFRTLDDCHAMIEASKTARKAVAIGGGLLGLEAARGLQALGVGEVHVVHLRSHLMELQLDSGGGGILRGKFEELGVQVHCDKSTTEVLGTERVTGLRFADGTMLDCDMVVIAAGIRPNVEIARNCGLPVERGILVGDDLRSPDDPSVFAIGECVQHRGTTYGLVAPLWDQARILADRLTERDPDAVYVGSRIATKLKVTGIDLSVMGEHESQPGDEVIRYVEESSGIYKKIIVREGRVAGAILLGDTSRGAHLLQMFDRGTPPPERRAELLFPAADAPAGAGIESMPDETQICNCNGISKGALVAAVKGGCRSMKSLCDATRAGLGCGSCKSQVEAVLEYAADGDLVEDPSVHYYVPGIPMRKPELIQAIRERELRSVSAVFASLSPGNEDPKSKMGLASLLNTLWGAEYVDERDARFINDRVHANVQKDGTFSVVPGISGGVTTPDQLRRIADVAEKYSVPMVKITGGQRIDLLGVKKEQLPDVWRDLGMRSGHAYAKSVRTVKTCVGSEFCRFGVGDSTRLGVEMEERFKGLESPGKLKLGVAGCPRNCSEALIKDVGVVAVEGGRWEVYVGGAGGAHVRKADLLCVVDSHEDVLLYSGRFIQYYRENANYLERTYGFVPRVGIERIREIVIEDAEGIAASLDAALQASIDAYEDPWLEGGSPVHPAQFASAIS
jgi:nitrite reductase (NADH) large subunit